MDLSRVKNPDKLELCRKYWLGGFALLPFLWITNCVWFFNDAFRKPHFEEQKMIRTYVLRSLAGAMAWITVIVGWVVIFQLNRVDWGATADYMSFTVTKNYA